MRATLFCPLCTPVFAPVFAPVSVKKEREARAERSSHRLSACRHATCRCAQCVSWHSAGSALQKTVRSTSTMPASPSSATTTASRTPRATRRSALAVQRSYTQKRCSRRWIWQRQDASLRRLRQLVSLRRLRLGLSQRPGFRTSRKLSTTLLVLLALTRRGWRPMQRADLRRQRSPWYLPSPRSPPLG